MKKVYTATAQDLAGPSLSHLMMICAVVVLSQLCSKLFITAIRMGEFTIGRAIIMHMVE